MTTNGKTKQTGAGSLIQIVLDRSGSMDNVKLATISGFNEFLEQHQREVPDAKLSLTLFSTEGTELRHKAVPVPAVPHLTVETYVPDGGTPLLDAIGASIRTVESYGDTYDRILFLILTDGFENASKEYTKTQIRELVEWHTHEGKGWEFMYLGANIDSYAEAAMIGVMAGSTSNYVGSASGTAAAFSNAGRVSTGYSQGTRTAALTQAERTATQSGKQVKP